MKMIKFVLLIAIIVGLAVFLNAKLSEQFLEERSVINSSQVSVDFSNLKWPITHVASGFLHNPRDIFWPPKEIILQVKPKQTRLVREAYLIKGMYDYVTKDLGIKSNTLLLNAGVMVGGYWPGDNGDWKPYEDFVTKVVTTTKNNGYIFEYEIWNEPNGVPHYWPRSDKQFFETWKRGYQLIKKLDPNLKIIGPSTENFGTELADHDADGNGKIESYMKEFLGYAKNNNVIPDILNWHELNLAPETNQKGGAANIIPHVESARKMITDLNLPIKKIYINEYSAETKPSLNLNLNEKFNGAYAIQYFLALEESRVDAAIRGCWSDKDILHRGNSCRDRMDNLITYEGKPRSNWYAYKAYAEMTGNLAEINTGEGFSGIATLDKANKTGKILLGATNPITSCQIKISNLPREFETNVKVTIEYIKYSQMKEASSIIISDKRYPVTAGQITLELSGIGEGDIYFISFNK